MDEPIDHPYCLRFLADDLRIAALPKKFQIVMRGAADEIERLRAELEGRDDAAK